MQATSRASHGHNDVDNDANERVVLRNRSSTRRHHQNPSPSPALSSTSLQRVDYSQMNHVGPPQPSRRADRRSVTPTGSTLSVPDGGGHRQRHVEPGDRGSLQWSADGSAVDNASWAEVDGERLEDAAPANEGDAATDKPAEVPAVAEKQPRLTARPSLRLRRHFECPDLVIINRNPSAQDMATACTSPADPAPPPQPQRRQPPAFSSSSSAAASGTTFASRLPRRRLTMPGIIKFEPPERRPARSSSATPTEPLPIEYIPIVSPVDVHAPSATPPTGTPSLVDAGFGVRGGRPAAQMYLVENCARKCLQEERISEAEATVAAEGGHITAVEAIMETPQLDGLDPPKPLTMRYR